MCANIPTGMVQAAAVALGGYLENTHLGLTVVLTVNQICISV